MITELGKEYRYRGHELNPEFYSIYKVGVTHVTHVGHWISFTCREYREPVGRRKAADKWEKLL